MKNINYNFLGNSKNNRNQKYPNYTRTCTNTYTHTHTEQNKQTRYIQPVIIYF